MKLGIHAENLDFLSWHSYMVIWRVEKLGILFRKQKKKKKKIHKTPGKSKISWGRKGRERKMDLFPCTEQTQSALEGKDFHKYIIFAENPCEFKERLASPETHVVCILDDILPRHV